MITASCAFSVSLLRFMTASRRAHAALVLLGRRLSAQLRQRLVVFALRRRRAASAAAPRRARTDRPSRPACRPGMPYPFSRNTWPFCVSGGIRSRDRLARERRHLGFAAEHGGRDRHRHLHVEVAALALEHRMRRQRDAQIEIARPCAPPTPCSPSPATRTREPSPTPAGMRTSTVRAWPSCLSAAGACAAVVRVLERQLDLVLDVAPWPLRARVPAVRAAPRAAGAARRRRTS